MFEHLIDFDPPVEDRTGVTPVEKLAPTEVVNAQISTADWLEAMGAKDDEEIKTEADVKAAREAFTALTTAAPIKDQHSAVTQHSIMLLITGVVVIGFSAGFSAKKPKGF